MNEFKKGPELRPEEEPVRYHAQETVNGIDINIDWSELAKEYTISFPQITDSSFVSHIYITGQEETAKQVFEEAKKLAEEGKPVLSIYKKIYGNSVNLPGAKDAQDREKTISESKKEIGGENIG